jgi:hypothetical protein
MKAYGQTSSPASTLKVLLNAVLDQLVCNTLMNECLEMGC